MTYYYDNMYRALSTLHAYGAATSKRTFGLSVPADGANLFLLPGFMIEDVEQLRTVRDYRTPRGFYQAPAPPPHSVSSARRCAACPPRRRPARRRAEWGGAGAQASAVIFYLSILLLGPYWTNFCAEVCAEAPRPPSSLCPAPSAGVLRGWPPTRGGRGQGALGACGDAYVNSFLFVVVVSSLFQAPAPPPPAPPPPAPARPAARAPRRAAHGPF